MYSTAKPIRRENELSSFTVKGIFNLIGSINDGIIMNIAIDRANLHYRENTKKKKIKIHVQTNAYTRNLLKVGY